MKRREKGKKTAEVSNGQTCFDTSKARDGARHVQGQGGAGIHSFAHVNADLVPFFLGLPLFLVFNPSSIA